MSTSGGTANVTNERVLEIGAFEKKVGHPPGLFLLFFAEMWERFSYYGMRALLVFYMTKGFLGLNDNRAYAVYGAYTSLVYMTPFIGGMIADKFLGQRRAVIIGGALMAAGHLLMTIENETAFFGALGLLICGNGFFKPNISTIVGQLYHAGNKLKRDGGFTVFYMGINLGAALAPLLCGYIGETYGWHYGFGLATIGMMTGLAVFVAPTRLTQLLIGSGALFAAGTLIWKVMGKEAVVAIANVPMAIALLVAALLAVVALEHGALPKTAGAPPPATSKDVAKNQGLILLATAVAIPVSAFLVSKSTAAGIVLSIFGGAALLWVLYESMSVKKFERQRLFVVLTMCFFSTLFWAFFEQAGSSMNNFTDRNVDRVVGGTAITAADVGKSIEFRPTQEQLGYERDGKVFTLTDLDGLRKEWITNKVPTDKQVVAWPVTEKHVGMMYGGTEIAASEFQAANPEYILIFGLLFTIMWGALAKRKLEPSIPAKFAMAMIQLGAGFVALWWGAQTCTERGMVGMTWLLLAYLLHTTGELFLSPVGLSMVTKLSPAKMVSTMMGAWFLATAFSEYLAGMIATLTGIHHGEGAAKVIPPPIQTVHVYGDVFGRIAIAAVACGFVLFALTPLLKKWIHADKPMTGEESAESSESEPLPAAARAQES